MTERVRAAQEPMLLRDVIEKLGITQYRLAMMLHAPSTWVGAVVSGKKQPTWATVCRIADILGVPVGVFRDNDPARVHFFQRVEPAARPAEKEKVEAPAAKPTPPAKKKSGRQRKPSVN